MPRTARKQSSINTYHIMLRGINRQSIFEDDEDYLRFTEILRLCKESCGYEIFAWCLMGNHVHLLMRFNDKTLAVSMKKIEISYAYYYNMKYSRSGHVMQDRFKSEAIEDDTYFYTVARYIHLNPVKAGICQKPEEYKWTSYRQYLSDAGFDPSFPVFSITDTDMILGLYGIDQLIKYTNIKNNDQCLELEDPYKGRRLPDDKARLIMLEITGCHNSSEFQKLSIPKRRELLAKLYEAKLNVLQINRLTGISRAIIMQAIDQVSK